MPRPHDATHYEITNAEKAQREMTLTTEDYEERWTGACIFENEWQSFRTRQSRWAQRSSTSSATVP